LASGAFIRLANTKIIANFETYMNKSIGDMLSNAEADIRTALPGFNAATQLARFSSKHRADIVGQIQEAADAIKTPTKEISAGNN